MVRRSLPRLSFKTGYELYSLYQVDIRSSVRNDLYLAREYHIQPSELRQMPYWIYEYYIEEVHDTAKKEAKEREDQEKQQQNMMPKMPTMSQMQSQVKMPSMPNMSNFKI